MIQVNTMLEESIIRIINNEGTLEDLELIYYNYYIDLENTEIKDNLGQLLLNAEFCTTDTEELEKVSVLKNVIRSNKRKVMTPARRG